MGREMPKQEEWGCRTSVWVTRKIHCSVTSLDFMEKVRLDQGEATNEGCAGVARCVCVWRCLPHLSVGCVHVRYGGEF
jgi:hypothetical protein